MLLCFHRRMEVYETKTTINHNINTTDSIDHLAAVQYSAWKPGSGPSCGPTQSTTKQPTDQAHTTKTAQEEPEECNKELKLFTWLQNAPDLLRHVLKSYNPWSAGVQFIVPRGQTLIIWLTKLIFLLPPSGQNINKGSKIF